MPHLVIKICHVFIYPHIKYLIVGLNIMLLFEYIYVIFYPFKLHFVMPCIGSFVMITINVYCIVYKKLPLQFNNNKCHTTLSFVHSSIPFHH